MDSVRMLAATGAQARAFLEEEARRERAFWEGTAEPLALHPPQDGEVDRAEVEAQAARIAVLADRVVQLTAGLFGTSAVTRAALGQLGDRLDRVMICDLALSAVEGGPHWELAAAVVRAFLADGEVAPDGSQPSTATLN